MQTPQGKRRHSRSVFVGKVEVGGNAPISIQSMLNTDTRDTKASLAQIDELAGIGCEIIRLAVPDMAAAQAIATIAEASPLPLVADIHFDHRLAVAAIENGAAAVRLNPGNLTDPAAVEIVAKCALAHNIPIRVGANAGSLRPAWIRAKMSAGMSHDAAVAESLVESAMHECAMLEKFGVSAIKVALKSSSVGITTAACREFASRSDYPLHLGITEAGTPAHGVIKSAIGIGTLLMEGIGDTIRVSLTAPPAAEVTAAIRILEACGLRPAAPELVSCPTCGRTMIDLIGLAGEVERFIDGLKSQGKVINLAKVAVMGCAVNGPGEARDADLGIAGSKSGEVVLFKFGRTVGVFSQKDGVEALKQEIVAACK
ncbi:MAG: flavodoxin-dependent (E)-4-hydroxy-3-methylbut-2-enyl-diphosphate synthase [Victivallaceae bacterium]|nr:flavodoxin-dependent (E)-4-hydroxy-3-methylbut-2-enyl-diphosphate synthase [Victivallaceae bacterium]